MSLLNEIPTPHIKAVAHTQTEERKYMIIGAGLGQHKCSMRICFNNNVELLRF